MSNRFEPGTYVKGDQARVCQTPADAVKAVFEGFKLQDELPAERVEVEPDEQDDTAEPDTRPDEANGHENPFRQDGPSEDDDDLGRLGSDFR